MQSFKQTIWVTALVLVCMAAGLADVPNLVTYQGRLTEAGEPVADGQYDLTFRIYTAGVGGTLLWEEAHPAVDVKEGLFTVILGGTVPLTDTIFAGDIRYLEVVIAGEPVVPRSQITAAAYSQRTSTVDGANGGTIFGDVIITADPTAPGGLRVHQEPLDPSLITEARIELRTSGGGLGSISIYDPVDSKSSALGFQTGKVLEMQSNGIVFFGNTESDTNLFVAPTGDIIGKGQLTMGENSIFGTQTSVLGFENTGNGDSSTIGGGSQNITNGTLSTIAGGHQNTANGEGSVIGGGSFNQNDGNYSVIGGGYMNMITGNYSVIPGGFQNNILGDYSYAAGRRANAAHSGSFVWADDTDADFSTTADDQFIVRAGGGVGLGTNAPIGILDVAGYNGDTAVNLPTDAISAPEIFDEPGLSSNRSTQKTTLSVGGSMVTLTSVTVNAPSDGYIMLRGSMTLEAFGTSKANQALMQIDQTAGGGPDPAYATLSGIGDADSPNSVHFFSVYTERVYFVSAGQHSFVLEAQAWTQNDPDAITKVFNPALTALYVPTSYGGVVAAVNGSEVTRFQNATSVNSAVVPAERTNLVDLRELELEAARARAAASEAEKRLMEARLNQ